MITNLINSVSDDVIGEHHVLQLVQKIRAKQSIETRLRVAEFTEGSYRLTKNTTIKGKTQTLMHFNSGVAVQRGSQYLFSHSDTLDGNALNHITQDLFTVQHLGHSISVTSHTADLKQKHVWVQGC